MTSSSEIRSAWTTAIAQHATAQAMTTRWYDYDVDAAIESTAEDVRLLHLQRVNFATYLATRINDSQNVRGGAGISGHSFSVILSRFLERDVTLSGDGQNVAIDDMDALDDLIVSQLGKTWSGTVDYWRLDSGFQKPEIINLNDRAVWRVRAEYRAFKRF